MSDTKVFTTSQSSSATTVAPPGTSQTVIVQAGSNFWRTWLVRMLIAALVMSVMFNFSMFAAYRDYFSATEPPLEKFHSGNETASDKIAMLTVSGTIMPPYTERLIKQIERVASDDSVKGALLVVDSPGGFVADSHQIYHELKKLEGKKPVYVQMKRMAASGGYYISMGIGPKGRIFAEPTTWTGSIGVIIPRYDVSQLAEKFGVSSDPLKTGEFKDALNPLKPLTDNERKVWERILDQSFQTFVKIIDDNRDNLDADAVKALATGQVYTADDAKANGLIDDIGFEEDALKALKSKLGLTSVRVISYSSPATLAEQLLGVQTPAKQQADPFRTLLESSVPRAYYLFSWNAPLLQ